MVGLRLASVLQPSLVESHFHRMDTALEIDANDVYLALLEELRCVAVCLNTAPSESKRHFISR